MIIKIIKVLRIYEAKDYYSIDHNIKSYVLRKAAPRPIPRIVILMIVGLGIPRGIFYVSVL